MGSASGAPCLPPHVNDRGGGADLPIPNAPRIPSGLEEIDKRGIDILQYETSVSVLQDSPLRCEGCVIWIQHIYSL